MDTYEIRGTFTYMVEAESEEAARAMLDEALGKVLWEWKVDDVSC